jgi:diaminopimelate epimerase
MPISFYKLTAAGNDFVLFYKNINVKSYSSFAKKICDRHYGVGGDGILILDKNGKEFNLRYFNSDGTEAFCGNGTRSAAFFIYREIFKKRKKNFYITTSAGRLEIKIIKEKIYLCMPKPNFLKEVFIENKWNFSKMSYIKAGTYHLVIETDDISKIDVYECGRFFRYHEKFSPNGTNVNFIKIEELSGGKVICRIRTYEKGVEEETLSCSSGIASSFYYLNKKYGIKNAIFISKNKEKFYLKLDKNENLYLSGPVKIVFKGRLDELY